MPAKKHKRCREDNDEEEKWTKERVEELKRVHARRYADLKRDYECAVHEANLARFEKSYSRQARLIDWLGGPEKASPDPIAKASMRLMRVKHENDVAERMVKYTYILLGGHNLSDADPVETTNAWMDALETWWNIEEAVDLFVKMMRHLERAHW